jgi:hypothetical protein
MPDQHARAIAEQLSQAFNKKHRTVLATSTTDGDREVATVIAFKSG